MNIELPDNLTIALGRAGKYGTMPVAANTFLPNVQRHIYEYGLRQIINDAMADKTDDDGAALPDDQIVAKAQKRLDNLYAGELRSRRDAEPADPVEAECYKIAKDELTAIFKKANVTVPKGTKDRLLYMVNASRAAQGKTELDALGDVISMYLAGPKGDAVRKKAARNVKERDNATDGVDLNELGM